MADTFVDYYEELEIKEKASESEIKKRLAAQRKRWRNKQGDPDPDVNYRASKMMQWIGEAQDILLDASKRSSYDKELAEWRKKQKTQTTGGSGAVADWGSEARKYLDEGKLDEFKVAVEEYYKLDQTNPDALILKATLHANLNESPQARVFLEQAIVYGKEDPETLLSAARLFIDVFRDFQAAENVYHVLHQLGQLDSNVFIRAAKFYAKNNDRETAFFYALLICNLCKDDSSALNWTAIFFVDKFGDFQNAEKTYHVLDQLGQLDPNVLLDNANSCIQKGNREPASFYARIAYDLCQTDSSVLNRAAKIFCELGEYQYEENICRVLMKTEPDNLCHVANTAAALAAQKNFPDAELLLQDELERNPDSQMLKECAHELTFNRLTSTLARASDGEPIIISASALNSAKNALVELEKLDVTDEKLQNHIDKLRLEIEYAKTKSIKFDFHEFFLSLLFIVVSLFLGVAGYFVGGIALAIGFFLIQVLAFIPAAIFGWDLSQLQQLLIIGPFIVAGGVFLYAFLLFLDDGKINYPGPRIVHGYDYRSYLSNNPVAWTFYEAQEG